MTRRRLFLAGLVPTLLVVAFALKVALMFQGNATGRDAFWRGDYDGATSAFAGTRSLNLLERWVAPFDEGTAHHAQGAWSQARDAYEDALTSVPRQEECTVRINLALVHEAVGDALAQSDRERAVEAWQRGIDVLAAGSCPTEAGRGAEQQEDAGETDRRLREKVAQAEDEQEPQQEPSDQGAEPDEGTPDPRQEELDRRNQRGLEQQRRDRELYEREDYARPESW